MIVEVICKEVNNRLIPEDYYWDEDDREPEYCIHGKHREDSCDFCEEHFELNDEDEENDFEDLWENNDEDD